MTSPLILVPQHDAIRNPEYFYEVIIAVQFSYSLSSTFARMMYCKILFKMDCFLSIKAFIMMYSNLVLSMILLAFLYFTVLVVYLGYDPPMPFTALIGYLSYYITLVAIWFCIPYKQRSEPGQRVKYKMYVAYEFFNVFCAKILQDLFIIMFKKTPSDFQWIVGFGFPILREVSYWLSVKILCFAFEERSSRVVQLIVRNVSHSLMISVSLGTFVTKFTGYVILLTDFALNIWNAIGIVHIHRKIDQISNTEKKLVETKQSAHLELVLIEIIEFIVPLVYIVSLVIALYGPNSNILGNYGNGYWTFEEIENVAKSLIVASKLVLIDLFSGIIGGLILWYYCSINFLMEVCRQIKRFWALITALLMADVNMVC